PRVDRRVVRLVGVFRFVGEPVEREPKTLALREGIAAAFLDLRQERHFFGGALVDLAAVLEGRFEQLRAREDAALLLEGQLSWRARVDRGAARPLGACGWLLAARRIRKGGTGRWRSLRKAWTTRMLGLGDGDSGEGAGLLGARRGRSGGQARKQD